LTYGGPSIELEPTANLGESVNQVPFPFSVMPLNTGERLDHGMSVIYHFSLQTLTSSFPVMNGQGNVQDGAPPTSATFTGTPSKHSIHCD
jgi:hypothetical protein